MRRHHFIRIIVARDVLIVALSVVGVLLMITMLYAVIRHPLYDSWISFCVRALVMIVAFFLGMLFDMGYIPCILSHYTPRFNSEMIHMDLESYLYLPLDLLDIIAGYAIQHRICQECRAHFLRNLETVINKRCYGFGTGLWNLSNISSLSSASIDSHNYGDAILFYLTNELDHGVCIHISARFPRHVFIRDEGKMTLTVEYSCECRSKCSDVSMSLDRSEMHWASLTKFIPEYI